MLRTMAAGAETSGRRSEEKRRELEGEAHQQCTRVWDENFRKDGGARKEKNGEEGGASTEMRLGKWRVAEWGREWNGKVEGEVGNEVYLIWVNLKLKWGKGNHWKWEPNNIKGNGVFPFPFPFLKTPNQTPPKCINSDIEIINLKLK